jgi:hypothetical protein
MADRRAYAQAMGKNLTFRADADLSIALRDAAHVNGVSVSRLVREACRSHVGLEPAELDRRCFNRIGVFEKQSTSQGSDLGSLS